MVAILGVLSHAPAAKAERSLRRRSSYSIAREDGRGRDLPVNPGEFAA